jgi:hypothetical protein
LIGRNHLGIAEDYGQSSQATSHTVATLPIINLLERFIAAPPASGATQRCTHRTI